MLGRYAEGQEVLCRANMYEKGTNLCGQTWELRGGQGWRLYLMTTSFWLHNCSEFVSALTRDWLFTVQSIELYVTPKWLWRPICTSCLFHSCASSKGPSFCFLSVFILIHFCYWVEVIFEFFPRKGTHIDFLRIVKYLKVTLLFFYEVEFGWV